MSSNLAARGKPPRSVQSTQGYVLHARIAFAGTPTRCSAGDDTRVRRAQTQSPAPLTPNGKCSLGIVVNSYNYGLFLSAAIDSPWRRRTQEWRSLS
jgi:hypothetical protein